MNILSRLKNNRTGMIVTTTLGRLCNYFWCQPGDLLVVTSVPPLRLAETVVRRPAYPTEQIPAIPIINAIPVLLRGHRPTKVASGTGLSRTAVYALMAGNDLERITFATLAALCEFLQVGVASLLTAELPSVEA
jgi:DNA-binding Xre family transcriptional regulator